MKAVTHRWALPAPLLCTRLWRQPAPQAAAAAGRRASKPAVRAAERADDAQREQEEEEYEASLERLASGSTADPRSRMLQRRQRRLARQGATEAAPAAQPSGGAADAQGQQRAAPRAGPSSRLRRRAARRRSSRVPAALTPEDVVDKEGRSVADQEEDEEGEAPEASSSAAGSLGADEDELEEHDDEDEEPQAAAAQEQELQGLLHQDRGSSSSSPASPETSTSTSTLGGRPRSARASAKEGEDQQQQQQRAGPVVLSERSPMYVPVLTDEDLAADPPGHKSGYVAVIGKPNAGKSTLINAMVGQKLSIVTFKPQTTRHRVMGLASDTDYQMILFDTPGIMREQRSKLDERMMQAVVSSVRAAEAIVAVVDAADDPQEALGMFQPGREWNGPPMAVLLNKADLVGPDALAALESWYRTNCRAEQVFVGSAKGGGDDAAVAAVKAWAVSCLPEGPTLYPKAMVSEQPERFFVSEIIREKIFLQYSEELPYASQVFICEFKERRGAKDFVHAKIVVERESQKGIIVGRGGRQIKALGEAARVDIEAFLERPVYLELSVEVAPDWRNQTGQLRAYGYYDPQYVS